MSDLAKGKCSRLSGPWQTYESFSYVYLPNRALSSWSKYFSESEDFRGGKEVLKGNSHLIGFATGAANFTVR